MTRDAASTVASKLTIFDSLVDAQTPNSVVWGLEFARRDSGLLLSTTREIREIAKHSEIITLSVTVSQQSSRCQDGVFLPANTPQF